MGGRAPLHKSIALSTEVYFIPMIKRPGLKVFAWVLSHVISQFDFLGGGGSGGAEVEGVGDCPIFLVLSSAF